MEKTFANPLIRLLAHLIDQLIGLGLTLVILLPTLSQLTLVAIVSSTLTAVIILIYLGIFLPIVYALVTAKFGGTPGKLITGLRVETEEGKNITFKRALFRSYIGGYVAVLFLLAGYFYIFIDKKRRGWHDLIAATVVVQKNPSGIFMGLAALLTLLGLNILYLRSAINKFKDNKEVYMQIVGDISQEINMWDKEDDSIYDYTDEPSQTLEEDVPSYNEDTGWATYTSKKAGFSFTYPVSYTIYDYTPESDSGVDLTLEGRDSNTLPTITVEKSPLTGDLYSFFSTKYKAQCPTNFDACSLPTTGGSVNYYQFETKNRSYLSAVALVSDNEGKSVYTVKMMSIVAGAEFSEDDRATFKKVVESFKFDARL